MKHLPNSLTVLRILFAPVLYFLILESRSLGDYLLLYYLFVIAGLTDIYDGQLARSQQNITTFGKFLDPVADKLILAATLVPFYMLSTQVSAFRPVTLPILLILLGREVLVTLFRYYSMWTGNIFSASRLAKFKTAFQMFFIGSILVHMAHRGMIAEYPEFSYRWFDPIHVKLNQVVIFIVVGLSVVSALEYFARNLPALMKHSRA